MISVLASGKPVVALLGWGRDYTFGLGATPGTLHWVALTGFDMKSQTMYFTDTDGGCKQMSFTEFNQKWNRYSSGSKGAILTGTLGVQERTILY